MTVFRCSRCVQMVSGGFKLFLVLVSTEHLYILPKLQRPAWKVHVKTAIFIASHFKIHIMAYHYKKKY